MHSTSWPPSSLPTLRPLDIRRRRNFGPANDLVVGSLDVVIAHYAASVGGIEMWDQVVHSAFVQRNPPRWIVYNKGNPAADFGWVRSFPNREVVVRPLPNIGREGHTYLHHIVHNYDSLANFTLFSQESLTLDSNKDAGLRLDYLLNASTAFLGLGVERTCEIDNATWTRCHTVGNPHLYSLYQWVNGKLPASELTFTATAVFIVSSARIKRHPLEFYKKMLDLISADSNHDVFTSAHYVLQGNLTLPEPFPWRDVHNQTRYRVTWKRKNPYL